MSDVTHRLSAEGAERLGRALGERTRELKPTVVLSPALGGVVIEFDGPEGAHSRRALLVAVTVKV